MQKPMEYNTKSGQRIELLAIRATRWIGSVASIVFHTIIFILCFVLILLGAPTDKVLLTLTTIVSLEAIYLSIFIQMSVNRSNRRLVAVRKDLEDIQEGVEEIGEDIEHIEEDIGEIQKDVEEIQGEVGEISDDIEDIQEDVKELGEEVEDIGEEMDEDDEEGKARDAMIMAKMEVKLEELLREIAVLKEQTAKKKPTKKVE